MPWAGRCQAVTMKIKIGKLRVDVSEARCASRPCFQFGFDKGSYSPGRGYTSYHKDTKGRYVEYPVCMRRHLHGCPTLSVCPKCGVSSSEPVGGICGRWQCDGLTVARNETK